MISILMSYFLNNVDEVMVLRAYGSSETLAKYAVVVGHGNRAIAYHIGTLNKPAGSESPIEITAYESLRIIGAKRASTAIKTGGWGVQPNALAYDGKYYTSSTSNATIQFTTTGSSEKIGVFDQITSSTKLAIVEINGDKTLANKLPTAQQLVNAGVISTSALIANGGTLDPSWRILNSKSPQNSVTGDTLFMYGSSRRVILAENLAPGVKTVKFTVTPYYPNGTSSTGLFRVAGIWYYDDTRSMSHFPEAHFEPVDEGVSLGVGASDHNFAFSFTPAGSSQAIWLGHDGTQFAGQAQLKIDGVPFTTIPPNTYTYTGEEVELDVSGTLRSGPSSPQLATFNQKYTFRADNGIKIDSHIDWLVSGEISSGYIPQLGVNNSLSRATTATANTTYNLDSNLGNVFFNQFDTTAAIWNPTTDWAILTHLDDFVIEPPVVNSAIPVDENQLVSTIHEFPQDWIVQFQDREGGAINKIYYRKYQNSLISPGDTVDTSARYMFKKILNVDSVLSQ